MSNPEAQKRIVKYSQYHRLADDTLGRSESSDAGFSVVDADTLIGVAEIWTESLEDLRAVFGSRYYLEIVQADELKFLDTKHVTTFIGADSIKWENGRAGDGVDIHFSECKLTCGLFRSRTVSTWVIAVAYRLPYVHRIPGLILLARHPALAQMLFFGKGSRLLDV